MRITRCYIPDALAIGAQIALPPQVSHHLVRVLRHTVGDRCIVFNGDSHDYQAGIVQITRKAASVEIVAVSTPENESPLDLTLVQGLSRGKKMDFIIQKATELGVKAIVPVMTDRSIVHGDEKHDAHWQGVIIAACEQSGRACIPRLQSIRSLSALQPNLPAGATLIQLDPQATHTLASLSRVPSVVLAIGPEGGWGAQDADYLSAMGFISYRMGPRILRTETAGIAAIAALQAMIGDL